MFTRFKVTEYNEGARATHEWLVDVPDGWSGDGADLKIARAEYDLQKPMKHYNMDSHTVRGAGHTQGVEKAVAKFLAGGGPNTVEKEILRWRVEHIGKVARGLRKDQHRRYDDEFAAVSANYIKASPAHDGKDVFTVDIMLCAESPARYQVVIPMEHYDDQAKWKTMLYRRLNPRSKGKPEYGLRPMAVGKRQVKAVYSTEQLAMLNHGLELFKKAAIPGDAIANSLAIFERQIAKATNRYVESFGPARYSTTYRLFEIAKTVGDALFAVSGNPTPENVERWQNILQSMNTAMEWYGPRFEQHLRNLEARAMFEQSHQGKLERAKNVMRQFTTNSVNPNVVPRLIAPAHEIPPMLTQERVAALHAFEPDIHNPKPLPLTLADFDVDEFLRQCDEQSQRRQQEYAAQQSAPQTADGILSAILNPSGNT